MKIVKGKEQEYKDWYEKNSDPYGRACFTYAERRLEHGKVMAITDEELKKIVWDAIKNNKVKYHRGRRR